MSSAAVSVEDIPLPVFIKWSTFTVGLIVVAFTLGLTPATSGLWLATAVFAHLIVFRPPKAQLTDADLEALLGRGV